MYGHWTLDTHNPKWWQIFKFFIENLLEGKKMEKEERFKSRTKKLVDSFQLYKHWINRFGFVFFFYFNCDGNLSFVQNERCSPNGCIDKCSIHCFAFNRFFAPFFFRQFHCCCCMCVYVFLPSTFHLIASSFCLLQSNTNQHWNNIHEINENRVFIDSNEVE